MIMMNRTVSFNLVGFNFTFEGVSKSAATLLGLLFVMLAVLAWGIIPLAAIWALNTLFPVLAIPFGVSEWAASLFLLLILTYRKTSK
jgi:uncharacterized membrane protein YuzA (DUF378 family)